jgi:hypothetical protein
MYSLRRTRNAPRGARRQDRAGPLYFSHIGVELNAVDQARYDELDRTSEARQARLLLLQNNVQTWTNELNNLPDGTEANWNKKEALRGKIAAATETFNEENAVQDEYMDLYEEMNREVDEDDEEDSD